MKVRKGQGLIGIDGLAQVISMVGTVWGEPDEEWPILRIQPQTVERDESLRGEGRPTKYVQSGEDIFLFPVPDGPYQISVTYYPTPRRV